MRRSRTEEKRGGREKRRRAEPSDGGATTWNSDVKPKLLSSFGDSKTSPAATQDHYVHKVPYTTASLGKQVGLARVFGFALQPNEKEHPEYYDSILNGVEIFKINGSDGNLAGPNPIPGSWVIPYIESHKSDVVRPRTSCMLQGWVSSLLFSEIKVATKNFDESWLLGLGGFGKVYRGDVEMLMVVQM
ncbi:hypothetical protein DY000_02017991 [Brassica cretica]|uniref:Protein kinase domain-containing protein n=1 Tax=Brassica cretica TaxID=69181 RepID=A0ABQ7CX03_BRACR|nr:hypothetical protein DY000_02017991 [Brassica cretica]